MRVKNVRWGLIALSCVFVLLGLAFAHRLGIEADEALLANGIYDRGEVVYSWKLGTSKVPVMLISYLGALKTWIYNPYLLLWKPGAVSLRVPTVLAGAASLWLFFALLDDVAGRFAAWIGTLLLATDSVFLLLETTDFGFVALQFLLKLSAILLLLHFHRSGSRRAFGAGFFLLGLAMWDKAVFAWVLFGLAAAALLVFPHKILGHLTKRNVVTAAASMMLGALPLLVYNIGRPLVTLRANAKLAAEPIPSKAAILLHTLDGSALFGFMTAGEPGPSPQAPHNFLQMFSLRISGWAGAARHNLILPALGVALAITLLAPRARRLILFGLLACAFTWLPMALTASAGTAVHHTILLWPWHLLAISATLAQLRLRWAATAAVGLLCISNLVVTNEYYAELIRNGPAIRWTDAIGPLEEYLMHSNAKRVFTTDWGFFETLNLLSEGELPTYALTAREAEKFDRMVADPRNLFVSHTPGYEYQPEIRAQIEDRARHNGLQEELVSLIFDRNGRPTFEVFRFRRGG
jgi:hypothetical protein